MLLLACPAICIMAQPEGTSNVGIGIVNPTISRLQVNGVSGTGKTSAIFGGDGTGISFQRNFPAIGFNQYQDNASGNGRYMANGFAATQTLDHTTGSMYFDMFPEGTAGDLTPTGNRSISISNTGNIGIRANPDFTATLFAPKLDNYNGAAVFSGSSFYSFFFYGSDEHTHISGGKPGSRVLLNDNNSGNIILGGNSSFVGINTSNPVATLDIHQVAGKGLILVDPVHNFDNWEYHVGPYQNPPESDLKLYSNEVLVSFFSSVYGYYSPVSSDKRIKSNIQPLAAVLPKLKCLQPKEYEMKELNQHEKTFGFIAQDVNQLYPEFVRQVHLPADAANPIPDMYSLNYAGFDVLAIKALQEQYTQLKTLKEKNRALLQKLEALEKIADKKLGAGF